MRLASALALSMALLCGSAAASPRHSLMMARVELGDLDLNSRAGATAMVRRLEAAARELCATDRSPLLPRAQAYAWRCRRDAVAAAVARLSTPVLEVAHAEWLLADPTAEPPSPRSR